PCINDDTPVSHTIVAGGGPLILQCQWDSPTNVYQLPVTPASAAIVTRQFPANTMGNTVVVTTPPAFPVCPVSIARSPQNTQIPGMLPAGGSCINSETYQLPPFQLGLTVANSWFFMCGGLVPWDGIARDFNFLTAQFFQPSVCIDGINSYTCVCGSGTTGTNCQTNIDECASEPCLNGATCADLIGSYFCGCVVGYSGTFCQTDINECASFPCHNNGTCIDGINSFSCNCTGTGYVDSSCSTFDACASGPCNITQGEMCINNNGGFVCTCSGTNITCDNDGLCIHPSPNTTACLCPAGYSGNTCQTQIDDCASTPCQNGAMCVDDINAYRCNCSTGYTGTLCQQIIDYCVSFPCQNNAHCDPVVNGFICHCVAGYS